MSLASQQALDTLRMDMERTQRDLRIEKDKLEKLEGEVRRATQDQKEAGEQHELAKRALEVHRKKLHTMTEEYEQKDREITREHDRIKQKERELEHHRDAVKRMEQNLLVMKRNVEDLQRELSLKKG